MTVPYQPASEHPKPVRIAMDLAICGIGVLLILNPHPAAVTFGWVFAGLGLLLLATNLVSGR
jgi:hypothetical protein